MDEIYLNKPSHVPLSTDCTHTHFMLMFRPRGRRRATPEPQRRAGKQGPEDRRNKAPIKGDDNAASKVDIHIVYISIPRAYRVHRSCAFFAWGSGRLVCKVGWICSFRRECGPLPDTGTIGRGGAHAHILVCARSKRVVIPHLSMPWGEAAAYSHWLVGVVSWSLGRNIFTSTAEHRRNVRIETKSGHVSLLGSLIQALVFFVPAGRDSLAAGPTTGAAERTTRGVSSSKTPGTIDELVLPLLNWTGARSEKCQARKAQEFSSAGHIP